jgi:hypothetical protein
MSTFLGTRVGSARLERFPAKWIPVRVKKTRQNKKESLRSDSIGTEKALGNAQVITRCGAGATSIVGKDFRPRSHRRARCCAATGVLTDLGDDE